MLSINVKFFFIYFFFFQAEDGIRDHCVTGVQTCALPISCSAISCDFKRSSAIVPLITCVAGSPSLTAHDASTLCRDCTSYRSEERRVGKECRSRWSPYH